MLEEVKIKDHSVIPIIANKKSTDISYEFPYTLDVDGAEIALLSFNTYYSWPNVTDNNNRIVIGTPTGTKIITLPKGAYEHRDINNYIIGELGVDKSNFYLAANNNTLKSVIRLGAGYSVDFTISTLQKILGFLDTDKLTGPSINVSANKVNITSISRILIHCDIAEGAYMPENNIYIRRNVIYDFIPDVPPGFMINHRFSNPIYLPVNRSKVNTLRIWVTDQNGNLIDNGDEDISITLLLKLK